MDEVIKEAETVASSGLLSNVVVGCVIVALTALIAHLLTRLLRRILIATPLPTSSIIVNIGRVVVWTAGISLLLQVCFSINATALLTALGVGGVALSLGLQDTLSNLIGGIQMTFMGVAHPGDNVEVGSENGVVQDVGWRHTTIKNRLGETIIIPNSVIAKTALVQLPPATQVVVFFAVVRTDRPMDELANEFIALSKKATAKIDKLTEEPRVLFTEITEYGFKGKIIVQITDASKANAITDAIVRAIAPLTR